MSLHVYTSGSQPAQYSGTPIPGMPIFYGPWGSLIQGNGQEYHTVINGVIYQVIPTTLLPYSLF